MILSVPTVLMGGTLPVIGKSVVKSPGEVGDGVGGLYGINTFGAVAGCMIAGFLLIELAGIKATSCIASFINLSVGGVAFLLSRDRAALEEKDNHQRGAPLILEQDNNKKSRIYIILFVYGLSGFTALAYEVIWTRVLAILFFTTTYAFTTMLSTMLASLALGSFLFRRFADRVRLPLFIFGILEMAIGLYAVFMPHIFALFPLIVDRAIDAVGPSWLGNLSIKFGVSSLIMFVPGLLMGAAFPLINRICASNMERIGQTVGSLYSFNSLGCIFGSFISGFIMIPLLGLQKTIICAAFINLTIGAAVLWLHKFENPGSKWAALAAPVLIAVIGVIVVPGDIVSEICAGQLNPPWRLSLCDEGIDGTTMILENAKIRLRRMMVNRNQYVGENSKIMIRVQK